MTPDPWGLDVPPHWGEIPRIVEGVGRVSAYRLRPEAERFIGTAPSWLVSGRELDGYLQRAGSGWVVLLEPGGAGQVTVPLSWVELVAG